MSNKPLISVTMPVLNRADFLPAAIDSLLAQTFGDWELVASDGGSTDGTAEALAAYAARDPRIRVQSDPGTTTVECRNAILPNTRGDYIAMLDSDDIALPARLERQLAFLRDRPDLDGAGCAFGFIDGEGRPIEAAKYAMRLTDPDELRRRQYEGWNCFVHSSMLIRRAAIEAIGGYRNIFRRAEDDDFFLRLLRRHRLANMPERLISYRWHDGNTCAPNLELLIYRTVALASAHLRLHGMDDPVDRRRAPFDGDFLRELLALLGDRAPPVWLAWIGLLQHYHPEERELLREAWRAAAALPLREGMAVEISRHLGNCREKLPDLFDEIGSLFIGAHGLERFK